MKKSYNVISVMLRQVSLVVKRVLAKCGFNCFKAAEHMEPVGDTTVMAF